MNESAPVKKVLGNDLGTTYSSAAYVDINGIPVLIEVPGGTERSIPSVVHIRDGVITVGEEAMHNWVVDEENVIRWVKRAMGNPNWQFPGEKRFEADLVLDDEAPADDGQTETGELPLSPEVGPENRQKLEQAFRDHGLELSPDAVMVVAGARRIVRDKDHAYVVIPADGKLAVHDGISAVQVSAEILKVIKANAESQIGEPIEEAVITCPAYFNAMEVENTKRAGELAGFKVQRIVREPVAAAVYHGVTGMREDEKVLVCDLGGGTFDATIITMQNEEFIPLETVGHRTLGGHDWTSELMDLVAERFADEHGVNPANYSEAIQALYEACEKAKRQFAKLSSFSIPCACDGVTAQYTVTRDEFEARTEYLIGSMLDICEKCLNKAGIEWNGIDRILMVGGSSRLRRVKAALAERSGKQPELGTDPDLMVTYGAAIMAGGLKVRDTTVRALGTRVYDPDSRKIVNALVMPHGLQPPVERSSDDFAVASNRQQHFDIPVVEFEDVAFDENEYIEPMKNYRCRCLDGARKGDRIKVTFKYDESGIIHARASDVNSGQDLVVDTIPYREPTLGQGGGRGPASESWVVFTLDVSYSMEGKSLVDAKKALLDNARKLLGDGNCKVAIVTFSSIAKTICDLTPDIDAVERCVTPIRVEGSTAMDAGIREAIRILQNAPGDVAKTIVLLTDGMPDDEDNALSMSDQARSLGFTLCALGLGSESVNVDFLKKMSLTDNLATVIEDSSEISENIQSLLALVRGAPENGSQDSSSAGGLQVKWE